MNDDELRQAVRALENYNQQLDALTNQARMIQTTLDEAIRASKSLEALAKSNPGEEILLPVGASSFVKVIVSEKKEALVGIGNDLSIEKDLQSAKDQLDSESEQLKAAMQRAVTAMGEIRKYSESLQAAIQGEYRKRREQQAQ